MLGSATAINIKVQFEGAEQNIATRIRQKEKNVRTAERAFLAGSGTKKLWGN